MPEIRFQPLTETDFPLLLKWLEEPHVKAWWDQGTNWTLDLVKQKYASYTKGYKLDQGIKKPIHAYLALTDEVPIAYVQFYNAWDFERDDPLDSKILPKSLAALDIYIGESSFLKKGFAPLILKKFLSEQVKPLFAHCLVDPDIQNISAIRAYENAGFKAIEPPSQSVCWMLADLSYSIVSFACFCRGDSQAGNLAAIVQDFKEDDSGKKALAAKLNLPVTVFIEDVHAEIPMLRFFYPTSESVLCLHGALAAAKHLMHLRNTNRLEVKIQSGQILKMSRQADRVQVVMRQAEILPVKVSAAAIAKMLNMDKDQVDHRFPCVVASLGSPKLLVPVKNAAILKSLKPHFDLIKKWSIQYEVNGLYVYSAYAPSGVDFIARGFNPKGGWNEDAATGVAAGALISILPGMGQKDFVVDQGDIMGEPSRIYVSLTEGGQVLVGGEIHVVGAYNGQ